MARILIADDDNGILDALRIMLEDEGYEVTTTGNGEAALTATPLPDLILLDIWLSGQDGRDICRRLKAAERTKAVPVILVSANRDTGEHAQLAGADGYLVKPFEMEDMLRLVAARLSGEGLAGHESDPAS